MAASYTRTQGANARAQTWDDIPEERSQTRGNWLPLRELDDDAYGSRPVARATTMHQRTAAMPAAAQPQAERPSLLRRLLSQPAQPPRAQSLERERSTSVRGVQARTLVMLAGGAVALLVAYLVISAALEWVQVKLDDFQYGRPRTVQMDAYVGHGESDGVPSHFVAMNLNRRVTILEMPGGDATKATAIVGPYLFGQGEDLTPVQLNALDINGDGKADLVVTIKNEQLIYLNDGTGFKLMSDEERAALQRATGANTSPAPGAGAQNGGGK